MKGSNESRERKRQKSGTRPDATYVDGLLHPLRGLAMTVDFSGEEASPLWKKLGTVHRRRMPLQSKVTDN